VSDRARIFRELGGMADETSKAAAILPLTPVATAHTFRGTFM